MSHLSLVKSLSQVKEEQRYSQDFVEVSGLKLLRGSIAELCGETGCGKTALTHSILASLTQDGEVCGIIDISNSFDPESAFLSGIALENILWVKCGGDIEKAFSAADLLVQAKGFGAVWLNLNFILPSQLRSIPSSFWYRFRTGIKGSPTLLVVTSKQPLSGSASGQSYSINQAKALWQGIGRFKLLKAIQIEIRQRKPLLYSTLAAKIGRLYEEA